MDVSNFYSFEKSLNFVEMCEKTIDFHGFQRNFSIITTIDI